MFLVFAIVAFLICRNINGETKVIQSDVPTVISELLLDYDSSIRPHQASGPTHVNLSVHYGYVGFRNNELIVTMFLRQYWNDERLKFKTPTNIRVKTSKFMNKIWTPDTFSPDALNSQIMNEGFIQITNDGQVKWSQLLKIRAFCLFSVAEAYRTDGHQNCSVSFSSYGYRNEDVDLQWLDINNCVTGGPEHPDKRAKVIDTHCSDHILELSVGKFSKVVFNIELQTPFTRDVLRAITSQAVDKLQS